MRHRRAAATRSSSARLVFLGPTFLVLVVVVAGPVLFTLATSFTSATFLGTLADMRFVGLGNYIDVLASSAFQRAFFVTLNFVISPSVSRCCWGSAPACCSRNEFPGRTASGPLVCHGRSRPWSTPSPGG